MSRLESVKALLAQAPDDSRIRFMLCMEFISAGRLDEAIPELDELIRRNPDYVAAYYQAGRASEDLGNPEAALTYYSKGIEAARRTGDSHSLSELQTALDLLA